MARQIHLSIADPCHESWDNMTTAEQGRFCASCQKQVIDFTSMTDAQLAAYFKKSDNGSVCGRFYDDQLSRGIPAPRKTIPWIKYFFQIALPAFLMSTRAATQEKGVIKAETTIDKGPVSGSASEASVKPDNKNIVRGRIVDENNVPVRNASVLIKGTNNNIATDTTGSFVIKDLPYRATLVLEVTALGYQSTQMVITPYTDLKKELFISLNKMRRNEMSAGMIQVIMGKPAFRPKRKVPEAPQPKSKVDQPVIRDTAVVKSSAEKPAMIKVYPNPVLSGTAINFSCEKLEEGYYTLQLVNQAGQQIENKQVWIDAEARIMNMEIPSVAAGTYMLRLTHKETGKQFSEKVIVQ